MASISEDKDADADTYTDTDTNIDAGSDIDGDADTDIDTDTDADIDTDTDTDTDTDADAGGDAVCWQDENTGLCWRDPPSEKEMTWQEATDYCDELTLDGQSDWRMPSIDELRSMIRGCPNTVPGGECKITDGSSEEDLRKYGLFCDCAPEEGPGENGCYWDLEITSPCDQKVWSSSSYIFEASDGEAAGAWFVDFVSGRVFGADKRVEFYVRCARDGQES
ncbi:MAG: DUF1566 domain-containing protein [Deltaproteobacteria bacterium]|nr:DUF1566 domain-containing protein [Deltaproteobacteria bacterium]